MAHDRFQEPTLFEIEQRPQGPREDWHRRGDTGTLSASHRDAMEYDRASTGAIAGTVGSACHSA